MKWNHDCNVLSKVPQKKIVNISYNAGSDGDLVYY